MASREPILIKEDDPSAARLLAHIVGQLDALASRFDSVQSIHAKPNSIDAADGLASNPLHVGQYVNYCLLAAADCCRSAAALVQQDGELVLPVVALHPLLRSAIEHAAMAIWILDGDSRKVRVLRRLQAAHAELTHEKALITSAVVGRTTAEIQEALRQNAQAAKRQNSYMRAIAKANGIQSDDYENRLPSWEEIIRLAGEAIDIEHDRLVTMWRFASGLSHPSMRRGTLALDFLQEAEDGNVLSGVLSAKSEWVGAEMWITHRVVKAGVEAWARTKVMVNAERPVPEPVLPAADRRGRR